MTQSLVKNILFLTAATAMSLASVSCAKESSAVKEAASETVQKAAETSASAVKAGTEAVKTAANDVVQTDEAKEHGHSHDDDGGHAAEGEHGHDHSAHAAPPVDPNLEHVFTKSPDDHYLGDLNAPNAVIIYASVTCPHCSTWFTDEWDSFKKEQVDTGKTLMVFREIPTQPQQVAAFGFMVAACAPEGKYMDNVVYQMKNQKSILDRVFDGKGDEVAKEIADYAGMKDDEALKACFTNQEPRIKHFNDAGARLNATGNVGVPTFIVNGKLFQGDTSAAGLKAVLTK